MAEAGNIYVQSCEQLRELFVLQKRPRLDIVTSRRTVYPQPKIIKSLLGRLDVFHAEVIRRDRKGYLGGDVLVTVIAKVIIDDHFVHGDLQNFPGHDDRSEERRVGKE